MASEICVLGAGIVGLTTALTLQNRLPSANITLLADKFTTETTSDGAAGLFCPFTSFKASTDQIARNIVRDSYLYYAKLKAEFGDEKTGIIDTEGFILSNIDAEEVKSPLLEDVVPEYKLLTREEVAQCPGNFKYGTFMRTFIIQGRRFLPFALQKFQTAGGKIVQREISSLTELTKLPYDVFVNCTGLGARDLFNDETLVPVRGQVIKVSAPWQNQFFLLDNDVYIIPGVETTLGGSRNYGSFDLSLDKHLSARIWEQTTAVLPRLGEAAVIREWVGLRPHRVPIRLEPETLLVDGVTLSVVHNYGHGGQGITTAPGSAKYAVEYVLSILDKKCKL